MPAWFWSLVVFGYGAIVGSFLNVLIYRMPLGLSVSRPPSHCPACNRYLSFWDNIPLLAFLVLRARCRTCRTPISWRYFCVELLTASLWVALYDRLSGETGISWVNYVAHALFASVLVAVIFIDLDHFIIPDELNWVGIALGVGRDLVCLGLALYGGAWLWKEFAPVFTYGGWLPRSIVGALVYGGLLYVVSFLTFVYYAREENESLGQVARRFFIFEDEPEADALAAPGESTTENTEGEVEEAEEMGEPVLLRFSPALLAAASALLLLPALGAWALLAFVLPLVAFVVLARVPGEESGAVLARFFRADDLAPAGTATLAIPASVPLTNPEEAVTTESDPQPPTGDAPAISEMPDGSGWEDADRAASEVPVSPNTTSATALPESALLEAQAQEFALDAESGKHGGMGLGDVKLALAIGAILGPGMALLSLFFATAVGAVTGIALAAAHGKGLRLAIPFGPFMALGAILAMLYGPQLVAWYLRFTGLG